MFCKNCGKELCEQAYVCPDCGCLVGNVAKAREKTSIIQNENEKNGLLKIFLMISFACLCVAFMFAFFWMDAWEDAYVILTSSLSFLALGAGIISFVFGLRKETQESMKLISIFNFMACVAMTGVGIYILCCI
ncbi:MAG: hypothetical protein IJ284_05740 [Clostridia bacterium]|nr:hypothetical protein [Clostridia bacterium]